MIKIINYLAVSSEAYTHILMKKYKNKAKSNKKKIIIFSFLLEKLVLGIAFTSTVS